MLGERGRNPPSCVGRTDSRAKRCQTSFSLDLLCGHRSDALGRSKMMSDTFSFPGREGGKESLRRHSCVFAPLVETKSEARLER
jgi:hypothetical protein